MMRQTPLPTNNRLVSPTLAQKYTAKKLKNTDYIHSSGYAKTQNGNSFGSTATSTFEERQAVEAQRKYVQKYRNAKILQGLHGMERAKTYIPRAEQPTASSRGRNSLTRGSSFVSTTPTTGFPRPLPTTPTISSPPSRRVPPISLRKP